MYTETGWYKLDGEKIFVQELTKGNLSYWRINIGWKNLTEEQNSRLILIKSIVVHK